MSPSEVAADRELAISKQTRLTLGLVVLLLVGTASAVVAQMTWQASVNTSLQLIQSEVRASTTATRNFHSVLGVLNPELTMPPDMYSAPSGE